jgi:hypothetical protein
MIIISTYLIPFTEIIRVVKQSAPSRAVLALIWQASVASASKINITFLKPA